MAEIYKLDNQIKNYEWGSFYLLPQFLGLEEVFKNKEKKPYAEMWMGTHNSACSLAVINDKTVSLKEITGDLPFLFKLLAVEKPLSIQVHPDKEQAIAGYNKENESGIEINSPLRCYKDKCEKDEILCAITPFTLMAGFRKPEETLSFFSRTPQDISDIINSLESIYPGDDAISSPLYLNLITLQPGQAVFLPAGIVHSYISGFGIELMNSSDNVLRGGLTNKYVNNDELIKIMNHEPYLPEIITPGNEMFFNYPIPSDDFSLSLIKGNSEGCFFCSINPSICIVTEGEMQCSGKTFKKGESFFIPKGEKKLVFNGVFSLYAASMPDKQ